MKIFRVDIVKSGYDESVDGCDCVWRVNKWNKLIFFHAGTNSEKFFVRLISYPFSFKCLGPTTVVIVIFIVILVIFIFSLFSGSNIQRSIRRSISFKNVSIIILYLKVCDNRIVYVARKIYFSSHWYLL